MSARNGTLAWLAAAIVWLGGPVHASEVAKDQTKVVETMRLMYVAATNDDMVQFRAVTAPGFYAFDGGKRMTGDELMGFIKSAHDAGKVYVWEVTEPQVQVDGTTAWITYVNRGSVKDATGTKAVRWLESAVLGKGDGTWRIQFFHSTRVPVE